MRTSKHESSISTRKVPRSLSNSKGRKVLKTRSKAPGRRTDSSRTLRAKENQTQISLVRVLREDHDFLQSLMDDLKKENTRLDKKKRTFEIFEQALRCHTSCEEEAVYKKVPRVEGIGERIDESYEEHLLAAQMIDKAHKARSPEMWRARVKLVCDLVEHHLMEEESDLLPKVKSACDPGQIDEMSRVYIEHVQTYYIESDADNAHHVQARDSKALKGKVLPSVYKNKEDYSGNFVQQIVSNIRSIAQI